MPRKPLILAALALAGGLALTACGADADSTGTVQAEAWHATGSYIYAVKVRIDDTHVVPCISRSGGGISCDWSVLHTPTPSPEPSK